MKTVNRKPNNSRFFFLHFFRILLKQVCLNRLWKKPIAGMFKQKQAELK
jgi:hypothetical protein